MLFEVTVNGCTYNVEVKEAGVTVAAPSAVPQATFPVPAAAPVAAAPAPVAAPAPAAPPAGGKTIAAPMPGKIVKVNVNRGDTVKRGDVLLILEAMKMQNEIVAPEAGQVIDIRVNAGQGIASGEPMIILG